MQYNPGFNIDVDLLDLTFVSVRCCNDFNFVVKHF